MSKKELMHTMSVQEKRETNGGSLTNTLLNLICDMIKGTFPPRLQ